MKKKLIYFFFFIIISFPCISQEIKKIQIPFLPYLQLNRMHPPSNSVISFHDASISANKLSSIFFVPNVSVTIRKQDLPKLKEIARRVIQKGIHIRVIGYKSSQVLPPVVKIRVEAVVNTLKRF